MTEGNHDEMWRDGRCQDILPAVLKQEDSNSLTFPSRDAVAVLVVWIAIYKYTIMISVTWNIKRTFI